jgi:2-keto-4-pentenoate hydratase/2-oxohepta-3-ene-1,7-dioic acid hydratase in catechol pathway
VLAADGALVEIPAAAGDIWMGCELAFVVGRLARQVSADEAAEYILGYMPLLSLYDTSFEDSVIEPASMQERSAPKMYGRWRDGFNVVGQPQPAAWNGTAVCRAGLDGAGSVTGSTGEYRHTASQVLASISRYITLFPGDVITLGRLASRLHVPAGTQASALVEIEGLGRVA